MANNAKTTKTGQPKQGNNSGKKKNVGRETSTPETETQSQSMNRRTSRGRTHNGSDGTSNAGRGSNH